jgi:hypothetical protein
MNKEDQIFLDNLIIYLKPEYKKKKYDIMLFFCKFTKFTKEDFNKFEKNYLDRNYVRIIRKIKKQYEKEDNSSVIDNEINKSKKEFKINYMKTVIKTYDEINYIKTYDEINNTENLKYKQSIFNNFAKLFIQSEIEKITTKITQLDIEANKLFINTKQSLPESSPFLIITKIRLEKYIDENKPINEKINIIKNLDKKIKDLNPEYRKKRNYLKSLNSLTEKDFDKFEKNYLDRNYVRIIRETKKLYEKEENSTFMDKEIIIRKKEFKIDYMNVVIKTYDEINNTENLIIKQDIYNKFIDKQIKDIFKNNIFLDKKIIDLTTEYRKKRNYLKSLSIDTNFAHDFTLEMFNKFEKSYFNRKSYEIIKDIKKQYEKEDNYTVINNEIINKKKEFKINYMNVVIKTYDEINNTDDLNSKQKAYHNYARRFIRNNKKL